MADAWRQGIVDAAAANGLPVEAVKRELADLDGSEASLQQAWLRTSTKVLTPEHELAVHQALYSAVYSTWPRQQQGPPPFWLPSTELQQTHNVTALLGHFKGDAKFERARGRDPGSDWRLFHQLSVRDPERVWAAVLLSELRIPLYKAPSRILKLAARPEDCRWLPGAALNIAWAALHAPRAGPAGDGAAAVAWAEDGHPSEVQSITRKQLCVVALHVAACLRKQGLKPGDSVAVVLPLTALSAAVYLGIVLSGCVVVSIADSFAAHEVDSRLGIAHAKLVFTQDVVVRGGKPLPLLPRVLSNPHAPPVVVIPGTCSQTQLLQPILTVSQTPATAHTVRESTQQQGSAGVALRTADQTWAQFTARAAPEEAHAAACLPASARVGCVHVAAPSEATNILFSSGTTGDPKAIIWDHITPLRAGADGWAHQDIRPAQRVCWPTSLGWMMGPWLLYATLLNGACVTLYHGAPLGKDFGVFVQTAGVNVLGLVPSIVKAWRHTQCMKGIDWPQLRVISSTGEASSPDDYHWLYALTRYRAPVIEYCGGTELGGAYITGSSLLPAAPSTFTTPAIGTQVVLLVSPEAPAGRGLPQAVCAAAPGGRVALSADGPGAPAVTGEVALLAPCLGAAQRLLNKDHHKVYYDGMPVYPGNGMPLRRHGDELCRLPGGHHYTALGRVDDTMNLGGIKVSSVELERAVVEGVAAVTEVAAIGVPTPGGGPEQLVLYVVLKQGHTDKATGSQPGDLLQACQAAIRGQLNPLFKVERVVVVQSLPRNASNKLMRRTLRDELMAAQQQQSAPRSKL